jgi:hypothetical protein
MKIQIAITTILLGASTVWAAQFTDDFNREGVALTTGGSQIGENWVSSKAVAQWGISDQRLISEAVGQGTQPVLYNTAVSTVSGDGAKFTVSLDVMALSGDARAGIAFNYQDENNFYWFRLKGGSHNWSLVRFVDGAVEHMASGSITGEFAFDMDYTITVSSPEAYTFDYEIKETATGEVLVSGTATDSHASFTGGYAGVLQSTTGPNRNSFDNFSVEVIPEPAPTVDFANPNIVFRESFDNPHRQTRALSSTDWRVSVGMKARSKEDGEDPKEGPVLSSEGFLFFRPESGGSPWLAWTEKVSGTVGNLAAVERIGLRLGNGNPDEDIRIALRVQGNWYVSGNGINVDRGGQWIVRNIDLHSCDWFLLNFVPEARLVVGELATLPVSGEIQGLGFFDEGTTKGHPVLLDDLYVQLIPEGGVESNVPKGFWSAALLSCPEANMMGFSHPPVIEMPGPEYRSAARNYQGIPGIERSPGGRLWATWYAGLFWEERFNYSVLMSSGDGGRTWSDDVEYVVDADGPGPLRSADGNLWLDPDGKLWWFWWLNEKVWIGGSDPSKISVTMAATTTNPDDERPQWSKPFPLFRGLMLNKPIVTSRGEWLMPSGEWYTDQGLRVMVSTDKGTSWTLRGTANVPRNDRNADEPMIVERKDGSLWMLVRTRYGIGQTISTDNGKTWTEVYPYQEHTVSRFYIGRLRSGNLLLIRHGAIDEKGERQDLTAYLSDDDGISWKGGLLLDERIRVSYPDAVQAPDGTIYAIYDFNRSLEKQIMMAVFTEDDILSGEFSSADARQKILINQANGRNPMVGRIDDGPPLGVDRAGVQVFTGGRRAELVPLEGEARIMAPREFVFSDANYVFRDFPGDRFFRRGGGLRYLFSTMGKTEARCIAPGMVYVFTPAGQRSDKSVETELLAQGFQKTSLREFDLIFMAGEPALNSNACSVFQKELKKDEIVRFGRWGVLVY